MLFLRECEEVGDMGVGGGGPGVPSVGVEGGERLVEVEEEDGETASSQVSATASGVLELAEGEMVRLLREESSPWYLSASLDRNDCVLFTRRSTRSSCHCCFQGKKPKALAFSNEVAGAWRARQDIRNVPPTHSPLDAIP